MASRRRVLTLGAIACAGLLAGCVDDEPAVTDTTPTTSTPTPEPGTPSPTPTPTPTPPPTPTPTPEFTADVSADPAEPVIQTVEVDQPVAYDSSEPVSLEVTLTNTGNEAVELHDHRPALFWGAEADGFGLYPTGAFDAYAYEAETGLWYATDEFFTSPGFNPHEFESGESISETLVLLRRYRTDELSAYPTKMVFETTFGYEDSATDESVVVNADLSMSVGE